MKKRCIFLYVNQGFAVRYFLRSGILKTLRNSSTHVVILSPNADEAVFRKQFESPDVSVEQFEQEACDAYLRRSKPQRILKHMRYFVLNGKYDTRTVDDFNTIFKSRQGWNKERGLRGQWVGILWEAVRCALKKSYLLRRLLIRFESFFFCPHFHRHLFDKYRPRLVVTSSLGWWDYDQYLMREARSHGVPTAAVILSWDNTTGMGMAGSDADHVVAWTGNMKKELIQYHGIDPERIFVGGVAHWDDYYNPSLVLERDTLFGQLGLDPSKKTIFFATKSPNRFPWAPDMIAQLAEGINCGLVKYPVQVLVRLHPIHYKKVGGKMLYSQILDAYEEVRTTYPFVTLNTPEMESTDLHCDVKSSETGLVASILHHSDVMLSMFSTMAIEAAIFDLPAINVCIRGGFKAADSMMSRQDIMIDFAQTHNQRVVQTGGVRTVFSMEELFAAINEYLDDPRRDAEQRAILREAEGGPFPGKAGEIIGRYLLTLAGGEAVREHSLCTVGKEGS